FTRSRPLRASSVLAAEKCSNRGSVQGGEVAQVTAVSRPAVADVRHGPTVGGTMPMTSPRNPSDHAGSPDSVRPPAAEGSARDAPAIPSFGSLRASHRRTALDVLMPEPPATPPAPGPRPATPPTHGPRPATPPTPGPRPAPYDDLWRLGVRTVCVVADFQWRLAGWSVRAPVAFLDRLLGR
ncbi:MAG TPA: hypothetical protein VGB58_01375, partial [Blastococcus sp.]